MSTLVSQIIDEVLGITGRKSDTAMRTRLVPAVDRAVDHWASRRPWNGLKRYEDFTANGTRFMVFPRRVQKPLSVTDLDNKQAVRGGTDWNLSATNTWSRSVTNDTPWEFRELGVVPVISEPSTYAPLEIEASVSEALTIFITGYGLDTLASGTALEFPLVTESFLITGTGATTTAQSYTRVESIEKSSLDGDADVIVRDSESSAPLSRIPADARSAAYARIEFLYIPPAGRRLRVEYYTHPDRVVNEQSALPSAVQRDYLIWRVVGDVHWIDNEPQQAQLAWQKADGLMQEEALAQEGRGDRLKLVSPRQIYFRLEGEDLYEC